MSPLSIEIQEVRMRSALRLVVFLVSSIVLLPVAARAQANIGFDIAWNHVALSVPNIAESIAWYEKMLGFKGTVRPGQPGARISRPCPEDQPHAFYYCRGCAALPVFVCWRPVVYRCQLSMVRVFSIHQWVLIHQPAPP